MTYPRTMALVGIAAGSFTACVETDPRIEAIRSDATRECVAADDSVLYGDFANSLVPLIGQELADLLILNIGELFEVSLKDAYNSELLPVDCFDEQHATDDKPLPIGVTGVGEECLLFPYSDLPHFEARDVGQYLAVCVTRAADLEA